MRISTSSIIAFSPATRNHTENESAPCLGHGSSVSVVPGGQIVNSAKCVTVQLHYLIGENGAVVGRVFEIVLPLWVGGKQRPPALALGQLFVSPALDHLIKLANFRVKITNETAEDPRLDFQAAWIVISVIELDGPRLECVKTFFNYDRITSISFMGPSKLERAFRRGIAQDPL